MNKGEKKTTATCRWSNKKQKLNNLLTKNAVQQCVPINLEA